MKMLSLVIMMLAVFASCSSSQEEPREIHFGPGPDGQAQEQPVSQKKR